MPDDAATETNKQFKWTMSRDGPMEQWFRPKLRFANTFSRLKQVFLKLRSLEYYRIHRCNK
jgi:hypothetical protein